MGIFFGLIGLIIPLGVGLAALFASILAHRGYATKGTWTLLISSGVYLLLLLGIGVSQFFFLSSMTSGGGIVSASWLEILMIVLAVIFTLSLVGVSLGAFWMTSHWKTLSGETAELEKKAQELAEERDTFQEQLSASN